MENSSIINSTMGDLGAYYVPQKYYDPNTSTRICCIEFPNNNHIYIKYEREWTVKDLIKAIIKTREFNLYYHKRDYILNSLNHLHLFDLHLCLYQQIKPDYENKISFGRICGNSTFSEPNLLLEIDHIIPVAKGGATIEENLQTLCWKCNRSKSSKLI